MASLAIALGFRQQANLDMPIQLTAAGQVIVRHRFEFTHVRLLSSFSLVTGMIQGRWA
jgi:hypothetical protein